MQRLRFLAGGRRDRLGGCMGESTEKRLPVLAYAAPADEDALPLRPLAGVMVGAMGPLAVLWGYAVFSGELFAGAALLGMLGASVGLVLAGGVCFVQRCWWRRTIGTLAGVLALGLLMFVSVVLIRRRSAVGTLAWAGPLVDAAGFALLIAGPPLLISVLAGRPDGGLRVRRSMAWLSLAVAGRSLLELSLKYYERIYYPPDWNHPLLAEAPWLVLGAGAAVYLLWRRPTGLLIGGVAAVALLLLGHWKLAQVLIQMGGWACLNLLHFFALLMLPAMVLVLAWPRRRRSV